MEIEKLYSAFLDSTGVCTDTRKLKKGNIFFSLKGENFNGNQYAEKAFNNGASHCVVDESEYQLNEKFLLVDDVLSSLQELAKYHRKKLGLKIIALTGSNGKTTTKELINTVLSKKYKTVATKGNLNNHIGVPLTLLSMDKTTEIGIVEMGANHLKEIEFLCNITQPDYGLITNFGKAHLEGFGSEENIVKGKSELYLHLYNNDKTIIANTADPKQMQFIIEHYGDNHIENYNSDNEPIKLKATQPFLSIDFEGESFNTNLTGRYNFNNILYAIAIGDHFDIPKSDIIEAVKNYVPDNNRSQIIKKNGNTIILDAYNANPTSMQAAIDNFEEINHLNKIAILGDMFELGSDADKEHQAICDYAEKQNINKIYLVGENFYKVNCSSPNMTLYKNYQDLEEFIKREGIDGSYILIKGSRGMALERILEII